MVASLDLKAQKENSDAHRSSKDQRMPALARASASWTQSCLETERHPRTEAVCGWATKKAFNCATTAPQVLQSEPNTTWETAETLRGPRPEYEYPKPGSRESVNSVSPKPCGARHLRLER